MADLLPPLRQRFFDSNGDPLAGGKLYSYEAGTTTPKATYTTAAASVANSNPIILDANGECSVYIPAEIYKFVLKDANDVTQWTVDNATLSSVSALASAFYRRQVNLTSASSPYTMDEDDNGTLFNVNSSGGAVVINAPEISSVDLPFNFAVILETAGNNCTINRAGTDTISGATSKVISAAGVGCQFVADNQTSPDKWSVIEFGTVADGAITNAKLATSAITGHSEDTAPDSESDLLLTYDSSAAALKKMKMTRSKDLVFKSKSATYTAVLTDDVIYCSGASWTLSLPTAVGCMGKTYRVIHGGTSISQIYTIDPNGSQTINHNGATPTTVGLYIAGEIIDLTSDNSNWVVTGRFIPNTAFSYTPTVTGFGTVSNVSVKGRRENERLAVEGSIKIGTRAAALPTVTVPSGLNIAPGNIPTAKTYQAGWYHGDISTTGVTPPATNRGPWTMGYKSGATTTLFFNTNLDLDNDASGTFQMEQNGSAIFASDNCGVMFSFNVPIAEWVI